MISNKKLKLTATELFARGGKLNIIILFLSHNIIFKYQNLLD